jgi:hypothetical protein
MLLQQYELRQKNMVIICFLESDRVKVGNKVTLKGLEEGGYWLVTKEYSKLDRSLIHDAHESKKWHGKDYHGKLKGLNVDYGKS